MDSSSESVDGDQKPPAGLDHPTTQAMLAQVRSNEQIRQCLSGIEFGLKIKLSVTKTFTISREYEVKTNANFL
jgi:hypothetical protein